MKQFSKVVEIWKHFQILQLYLNFWQGTVSSKNRVTTISSFLTTNYDNFCFKKLITKNNNFKIVYLLKLLKASFARF